MFFGWFVVWCEISMFFIVEGRVVGVFLLKYVMVLVSRFGECLCDDMVVLELG